MRPEMTTAVVPPHNRWHFAAMHTLFAIAGSIVNFVACLSYVAPS
jgi:hypothetical protein